MIKKLLRKWLHEETPQDAYDDTLDMFIRHARRCAYDLKHCVDMIDPKGYYGEWREPMTEKAKIWVSLFKSGNEAKDYRNRIYRELEKKDEIIHKLRAQLAAHAIDDPTVDDQIPF